MNRLLFNKCVAELLGAFAIVFFGCGYVAISANPSPEFTSVIFGTTVSLMIYSVGHVSGAHFNPAVTLGFASIGWFSWKEVPFYIVFQIIGAIFAAALLSWFIPNATTLAPTTPSISTSRAFFIEAILSFFLMFVITSMSTDPRAPKTIAGIAIGSTVAVDAFLGGPLTGASMNPARTIGPALIQGEYHGFWIYLTAPPLGAVMASKLYEFLKKNE